MGIFQKKQSEEELNGPLHFFDEVFRDELRRRGREYFEKAIDDNATLFKKDLDATVTQVNGELHQHITEQLDTALKQINAEVARQLEEQFTDYGKAMKEAQDITIKTMDEREKALEIHHKELSEKMQASITNQEAMLVKTYQENMERITAMNEAQGVAVQMLNKSVQALEQQHQQLSAMLQQAVTNQQNMLVQTFEDNMAAVVEHYLLAALGDQFDLKAQLPAIIKQMNDNKEDIMGDMKL